MNKGKLTFQWIDDCAVEFYDYAAIRVFIGNLMDYLMEHDHAIITGIKVMRYEYELDKINQRDLSTQYQRTDAD